MMQGKTYMQKNIFIRNIIYNVISQLPNLIGGFPALLLEVLHVITREIGILHILLSEEVSKEEGEEGSKEGLGTLMFPGTIFKN
jgi:hypothetical protein